MLLRASVSFDHEHVQTLLTRETLGSEPDNLGDIVLDFA